MFPAAEVTPGASGSKPPGPYSYGQPGQLFSVQPKVEPPSSSMSAASTSQTWKIMESLKLGPQPKANPVPIFTMSPAPAASSTSTTTTANSTANQDYSTVNLADLHEFFPNISSAIGQEPAATQGSAASSQTSSSFSLQSSQFRVDGTVDEDIPEFPSFSEGQVPLTFDSLNMDELEDLLNPRLTDEVGSSVSMLASCQQTTLPSSASAARNSAASQNASDPAGNPGSTWMNYPNSIVNLLQNENMMDATSSSNNRSGVLDDFDELMSADEERLISIFNNGSQAGFVSGHPT